MFNKLKKICPIIIDIETSGLNTERNTILEIALINVNYNKNGHITPNKILHLHVIPFNYSQINNKSLLCNKIDIFKKIRFAISEKEASIYILEFMKNTINESKTKKCVLVGHNCWFDLIFLNNLMYRTKKTTNYYHQFTTIDTATLGNIFYKQSTLSKLAKHIGINFNNKKNHSAIYDAKITTLIFCHIINKINEK
ncbi:MAG: ribonuclease T [Candidatus Azosocius agrarius]|nr:MAG: ribonuclease T [Gammaproteobacteria bacterium]